jgi:hypothetical protein
LFRSSRSDTDANVVKGWGELGLVGRGVASPICVRRHWVTRGLDIIRHRYDDGKLTGPATRKTNVRAYSTLTGVDIMTNLCGSAPTVDWGERAHQERRTVTQIRRNSAKVGDDVMTREAQLLERVPRDTLRDDSEFKRSLYIWCQCKC